ADIEFLNDNPTPDCVFNSFASFPIFEESDNSLSLSLPEFGTFSDHTKETRSGSTTTHDSLPEYDSFCFKIEPDQEKLTNVVKNDIYDDSTNDPREECYIEACRKQKQNMEDTMLELVEENQKVKNVVEQPAERETHIVKSLQIFRVIHEKSSTTFNKTSQISPVHAITPVLSIEEPEYSLSIGYEHLSTILKTESYEVTESSVEKLVPIPSEYEVTSEDKKECDVPVCKDSSTIDVCENHYEI
nr:hypothetical protein [Tanacetum cinerariifolium]